MIKRIFDILVSVILITIFIPVYLFTALIILFFIGRPIFFRQERPGFHGASFEMIKFRTMDNSFNSDGLLMPDNERITAFGHFLRATSLDELPELWNVIKGDMSLVGPRPLLREYLELYSDEQAQRHWVRPGITGWAQVNGRNAISWEEKFKLDVWYVHNHSFYLDIKILCLTLKKVLLREGISAEGETTMPKFTGGKS